MLNEWRHSGYFRSCSLIVKIGRENKKFGWGLAVGAAITALNK
jgi:hypothetical protein